MKSLTRSALAEAVHQELGLPKNQANGIVVALLEEVVAVLQTGQSVSLPTLGTLTVCHKKARLGRNPRTGREALISARRVTLFRASRQLKDRVW